MWSLLQDREDSKTGIERIIAQTLSLRSVITRFLRAITAFFLKYFMMARPTGAHS
jgi:hypothetical protein